MLVNLMSAYGYTVIPSFPYTGVKGNLPHWLLCFYYALDN